MKELIYLDTSFLHSFLAQHNEGLPMSKSTEHQESESKTLTKGTSSTKIHEGSVELSSGELKLMGLIETPSAKGRYRLTNNRMNNGSTALTQLDAGKEIISKQLHDNALHEFENYLIENSLLVNQNEGDEAEPGTFLNIRGTFSIVSLDYLMSISNSETIMPVFQHVMNEELETTISQIAATSDPKKGTIINRLRTESKKEMENQKTLFEKIEKIMNFISTLLPTKTFIRIGNYLCPVKDEYLREGTKELTFKYGTNSNIQINVLGKFTRVYDNIVSPPSEETDSQSMANTINTFSDLANNLIGDISLVKKGDIIVSPIAIYFE
ncbi:DUF6414 family protein [Paenibacillus sp. EKM211P]|uniref:DUF6414 family protein n=1 Tax=Paenibacillus sp. EKM211P TaxID=1683679 RepID=UPI0013E98F43|nr:hypothetical protein [Paenibacillus sp. EKM211P]KAF6585014.1 hypothetical protein G9G57_07595 [Paenibacillus sp. EKM211P]